MIDSNTLRCFVGVMWVLCGCCVGGGGLGLGSRVGGPQWWLAVVVGGGGWGWLVGDRGESSACLQVETYWRHRPPLSNEISPASVGSVPRVSFTWIPTSLLAL